MPSSKSIAPESASETPVSASAEAANTPPADTLGALSRGRIPSLDGVRAVAVGLVVLAHLHGTRFFPVPVEWDRATDVGNLGVRVFFVLSGFLITTLLLREHQRTGRISLTDFYMRRAIRIFPALYVFVGVMALATVMGLVEIPPIDFLWASTYTINYFAGREWEFGHLWSLAVEEQFYLTWPLLVIIFTPRKCWWVALLTVAAAPFMRVGHWIFFPEARDLTQTAFHTVADALATGCLLAAVRSRLDRSRVYLKFMASPWVLVLPIVVYAWNYMRDHIRYSYTLGETFMNIGIALMIDWSIRNPSGRIGRVLNSKPVAWVGVTSYSLYLWQQPFLNRASDAWPNAFPFNIGLAVLFAYLSYRLIERPLLTLRSRFRHAKMQDVPEPGRSAS